MTDDKRLHTGYCAAESERIRLIPVEHGVICAFSIGLPSQKETCGRQIGN